MSLSSSNLESDFSITDSDSEVLLLHQDYSPPAPPPPPPHAPSVSSGKGSFYILPGVRFHCPISGCSITLNISGNFSLAENSSIVTGTFELAAYNASFFNGSAVNTTGWAGDPPAQTSGTPLGVEGAGGGHGGRGASCLVEDVKLPEDVWGGDVYSWSSLQEPSSYGSKEVQQVRKWTMEGEAVAGKGGGGSGGSIHIIAHKMIGGGRISACGGNGFGGGGGGRVAVDVFSKHDEPKIYVHGGISHGCPENAGAAGTLYDDVPRSLIVNNFNMSTDTETLLPEFPYLPLWTNVYIKKCARVSVPLLWSRVQVQGQTSLLCGGVLSFGLAHYATSQFELLAEELLMSDSIIKVYGALRMTVKIFLMWNSKMLINGGEDLTVATSWLEASNLVILKESSVIHSNANLGVHGQGLLNLSGPGDKIQAQRLVLSLFYSINVGPGSVLHGPLEGASSYAITPKLYCEHQDCPIELFHPPEDCNVNSSLPFTLQICRVEDITVEGLIKGSVVHFHRARTISVQSSGIISASGMGMFLYSGLGCIGGVGRGNFLDNGIGSGGGHGGKGGLGCYNGSCVEGGNSYGNSELPCELGSGSGNESSADSTAGGGVIVMGSMEHPLSSLSVEGAVRADGESFAETVWKQQYSVSNDSSRAPGGGSGGTVLLFLHTLTLGESTNLSSGGGYGSPKGGGGGGGGRIHFHWSDIPTGNVYQPIARVKGSIYSRGGLGRNESGCGENGTVTGKACPKGLYGTFCVACPVGTYKNVSGSDSYLCCPCPVWELPSRAIYTAVRGGIAETPCPYKCISDRYMPHCYTALEELIYTFGGPWLFCCLLVGLLILLPIVLSVARMKFVGVDELPGPAPTQYGSQIDHSFPFLESLNEVLETNRVEESQSHVHRMYFMGLNTFSEPWHLPHTPPDEIKEIVRYDHACLRSCRSRALYEGLKVSATSDLMLAYVDVFLGGDEKRSVLPPRLPQRFPMAIIFGGDGSYMAPFSLQNDNILTSLMSQLVPPTTWYRLVAGLNAQLRLVRRGQLRLTFRPVLRWLETHANPALRIYGVCICLAWFQAAPNGYNQYGLLVSSVEEEREPVSLENNGIRTELLSSVKATDMQNESGYQREVLLTQGNQSSEGFARRKRIYERLIDTNNIQMLEEKRDLFFLLSFIVHNTRPVGHQDLVGLVISMILLGDFSLVLLTLLLLYSISLLDVFLALFILPLGILLPFPAGINALFSHGPRHSAGLARVCFVEHNILG
ncbi:putative Glutamyl-tRNA(Gln) amidotransferase subunit C [Hibiscus syriacus]|uniref:Glutamyl-tRNA(Gln) amidotransferase subunit C n=1 Tax=Hibiscus syriacus TaxID=106335 RepID=A0A6A2XSW8_HIBSY|nr:putative Glutamyl-tRNA(Gln) amidotransferase subunit C [Hibiscus syriacus]